MLGKDRAWADSTREITFCPQRGVIISIIYRFPGNLLNNLIFSLRKVVTVCPLAASVDFLLRDILNNVNSGLGQSLILLNPELTFSRNFLSSAGLP